MNLAIETQILTLGSGKLISNRIGPRASYLDRARANKLPVPPGVIIPEELIRECYASYGSSKSGNQKNKEHSVRLVREDFLRDRLLTALPLLSRDNQWKHDFSVDEGRMKVAIRPVFSFDGGEVDPPSSMFHSELNVDSSSAIVILESIKSVLASAHNYQNVMYEEELTQSQSSTIVGHNLRRDVLIMPMVKAQHSGLAFLQHNYEDDVIEVEDGLVVTSKQKNEKILLPKLGFAESPQKSGIEDYQKRLQLLIKKVRRVFGHSKDLEIEWSDDGKQMWLLQIRHLSYQVERKEVMSSLVHKELFTGAASTLTAQLIEECANKAFAFLRVMHPSLPGRRVFVQNINNQLSINISLLCDVCRIVGLPTSIVSDYLLPPVLNREMQLVKKHPMNALRIVMKLPLFWTVFKARFGLGKTIRKFIENAESFTDYYSDTRIAMQHIVQVLTEGFKLILLIQFALVIPTRILQKFRLLDTHLQRRESLFRTLLKTVIRGQIGGDISVAKQEKQLQYFLAPNWDLSQTGQVNYSRPLNLHTLDLRQTKKSFACYKSAFVYTLLFPIRLIWNILLGQREKVSIFLQSQLEKTHDSLRASFSGSHSIWNASFSDLLTLEQSRVKFQAATQPTSILPIIFESQNQKIIVTQKLSQKPAMQMDAKILTESQNLQKTKGVFFVLGQEALPGSFLGISDPSRTEWYNISENKALVMDKVSVFSKSSFDARSQGFQIINISDLNACKNETIYTMTSANGPLRQSSPQKLRESTSLKDTLDVTNPAKRVSKKDKTVKTSTKKSQTKKKKISKVISKPIDS